MIDGVVADGKPAGDGLEQILELAATLVLELSTRTCSVSLLVADELASQTRDLAEIRRSNGNNVQHLLERLAIAKGARVDGGRPDPFDQILSAASDQLSTYDLLVLSVRPFSAFAKQSGEVNRRSIRAILRRFQQQGRLSWVDVNAPKVQRLINVGHDSTSVSDEREGPIHVGR